MSSFDPQPIWGSYGFCTKCLDCFEEQIILFHELSVEDAFKDKTYFVSFLFRWLCIFVPMNECLSVQGFFKLLVLSLKIILLALLLLYWSRFILNYIIFTTPLLLLSIQRLVFLYSIFMFGFLIILIHLTKFQQCQVSSDGHFFFLCESKAKYVNDFKACVHIHSMTIEILNPTFTWKLSHRQVSYSY